jgi:hypothetical protein
MIASEERALGGKVVAFQGERSGSSDSEARVCSCAMAAAERGEHDVLVQEAEDAIAPLSHARNIAWWDVNVEANDENERRRAETELAYSNLLADAELFGSIERARKAGGNGTVGRRLGLLSDLMLPHQVPAAVRERIVELEAGVGARFSRHRGVVGG